MPELFEAMLTYHAQAPSAFSTELIPKEAIVSEELPGVNLKQKKGHRSGRSLTRKCDHHLFVYSIILIASIRNSLVQMLPATALLPASPRI